MGVRWAPSADRHGVPHEDALYAITHAVASEHVVGRPGEVTVVYVGLPHRQAVRYLEVIVAIRASRDLVVFHAMELSDVYRHLLPEGSQ